MHPPHSHDALNVYAHMMNIDSNVSEGSVRQDVSCHIEKLSLCAHVQRTLFSSLRSSSISFA